MNITKCANGHFYDEDRFPSCPHCASMNGEDPVTVPASQSLDDTTVPITGVIPTEPAITNIGGPSSISIYEDDDNKTISYYSESMETEPVTGWLVCVKGEEKGVSYCLKAGKNFVGRSSDMDVAITSDKAISRDRHAIIVYEPRARMFLTQPGESKELFYLNDKPVLSNEVLKPYDEISIGKTKLLFVPFCGESFSWDEEKSDKE